MPRVANWNPHKYDGEFMSAGMDRLRQCAEVIAEKARINLGSQIGKGKTTGISHGPYKTGRYAGVNWTAREFGSLMKTIRVVEKHDQAGALIAERRDIRVYAGNYLVWYAKIFEYTNTYLRRALNQSKGEIRSILESGKGSSVRGTTGLPSIESDPGWIAFRSGRNK